MSSSSRIGDSTSSHQNSEMNDAALASLRTSIINESLLLTKALIALGCTGIVFIIALVWAIRRITVSDKRKRVRGRRIRTTLANDGAVPSEIGMPEHPSVDTTPCNLNESIKRTHDTPLMFPLSTSTERDFDGGVLMRASQAKEMGNRTVHETLHLISPSTPSFQGKKSAKAAQCVEECSTKSLRHWYEDYLSPHERPKQHHGSRQLEVTVSPLTPSAKSVTENATVEVDVRSTDECVARQLSMQLETSSIHDDKLLDDGGRSTNASPKDACDFSMDSGVNDDDATSRETISESEPKQDPCNVTQSSRSSSTCSVAEDGDSQSLADAIGENSDFSPFVETEESVSHNDLAVSNAIGLGQKMVHGKTSAKYPLPFMAELVERVTGTKAPSPNAALNDFSTILAQKAFEVETGRMQSISTLRENAFATSLAKRVADVETWRTSPVLAGKEGCTAVTPPSTSQHKRKPLTPVGTPESSRTGIHSDEFLSDYW
jgi:hypothetical protein